MPVTFDLSAEILNTYSVLKNSIDRNYLNFDWQEETLETYQFLLKNKEESYV